MPKADFTIQVVPVGWEDVQKRFADSREHVLIGMNRMLRRMGDTLKPSVKGETPTGATNRLRNTTAYQVLGTDEDMRMEIRQSAFSPEKFPYGVAVRMGTRPHFPPSSALVPWVERKLGLSGRQARGIAFVIARKISRTGTKANPYHVRAYESKVGALRDIINDEIKSLIDKMEKQI